MKKLTTIVLLILTLTGCMERFDQESDLDSSINASTFDFNTITNEEISVHLQTPNGQNTPGIMIKVWNKPPPSGGEVILKLITDEQGMARIDYNLSTSLTNLVVEVQATGFPRFVEVTREQLVGGLLFQGSSHSYKELASDLSPGMSSSRETNSSSNGRVAINYLTLGSFDSQGVPDYLDTRDDISAELLQFIDASLPEGRPVPTYHPRFIADNAQSNLVIEETADVWVTFVHEGAGYRNVLGFYTYPTGTPPTSVEDIGQVTIIFPNVSFRGSGGGLISGDKVAIGQFEPGTSIGFVLLANGWRGSITDGIRQVYSHDYLNPETDPDLQAHNVLLWDEENSLFLLGFEDLNRMEGSDDDFNDAVFYITSNPVEAISTANVNPIDRPEDTDGDGVNDTYDEFPNDSRYAYSYVYPGENSYGTFAFEDQWPGFGDYDFNDLVVDYQYSQLANGVNKMVELRPKFIIKAVGAGFSNGFGIQLDVSPEQIDQVSGSQLGRGLFNIDENGTESGQQKAVIIASDDVHRNFSTRGFVNTDPSLPFLVPDTIDLIVKFTSPQALSGAGSAPFNPFLVVNQTRGREVHIPGYDPTDLVDPAYFGTGNDNSSPGAYYRSKTGLPWGMNLPVSFQYPVEKTSIRNGYNHFDQWANSLGFSYMDWYDDEVGYRNSEFIYKE